MMDMLMIFIVVTKYLTEKIKKRKDLLWFMASEVSLYSP
jgi:hypothetical protein